METFRATGTGNMGDTSDDDSGVRFRPKGNPAEWFVAFVRSKFSGGTGTGATFSVKLDHRSGERDHDVTLARVLKCGTDDNANVNLPGDPLSMRCFDGDETVLNWTNPDPGNMRWAVEVGLEVIRG